MFLAIDLGSSRAHFGLFGPGRMQDPVATLACSYDTLTSQFPSWLQENNAQISTSAIASVHDQRKQEFDSACSTLRPTPIQIPVDCPVGIENLTAEPEQVGIDRLLNAYEAYLQTAASTLVIDLGTAITVDAIDHEGRFLGGIIAPGLQASLDGLHALAPQLPRITMQVQQQILGTTTEQAMNSAVYHGTQGMLLHMIDRLDRELGCRHELLFTGGDATVFAEALGQADRVRPHLTLQAIYHACQSRA